jgi:hypothetical protein
MRLIDADALLEKCFGSVWLGARGDGKTVITMAKGIAKGILETEIQKAPTIEAKPVVYCKDCKYNVANSIHDPLDITDYTDITCEYFMTDGMLPNDYCSQGVKIPVISMEAISKMIEKELPSVEENPIFRTIREIEKENSNDKL